MPKEIGDWNGRSNRHELAVMILLMAGAVESVGEKDRDMKAETRAGSTRCILLRGRFLRLLCLVVDTDEDGDDVYRTRGEFSNNSRTPIS
jgi:hypothetical protein